MGGEKSFVKYDADTIGTDVRATMVEARASTSRNVPLKPVQLQRELNMKTKLEDDNDIDGLLRSP